MRFNIIWLLTKNNLRGSFNQNRNASKRKKQSSSLLALGIVFLLLSTFYNFSIVLAFQQMDMLNQYLPMVIGLSALLTFVFTLFKYESTIFGTKDYELLESMPITKKEIVASKILYLYIYDIVETAIIVIPAIVFSVMYGLNPVNIIWAVIMVAVTPFAPMALSGIFAYLFSLITARMKHKNIITVILYLVYMTSIMFFSLTTSSGTSTGTLGVVSKANPLIYFINQTFSGNILNLLWYVLINVGAIIILVLLISLGYHKINNWHLKNNVHTEYKASKNVKNKTVMQSLVSKELKAILRKPMYLMNSCIGALMCSIMPVVFYFISMGDPEIKDMFLLFALLCMGMMAGMSSSTNATISLEGRSFESLKTYPVEREKILKSKIIASLIIPLPLDIIAGVVYLLLCKPTVFNAVSGFVIPIIGTFNISFFGMLCNLKWNQFEYDNETQILKNSKPVMVSTFTALGINFAIYIIAIVFSMIIPEFCGLIACGLYGLLLLIVYIIYKEKAVKMFEKI